MHPNVQNDIKLYLNKPIELNEQSLNEATNEIHKIFNKVAKLSLKQKTKHSKQEIKNGLTLTLIKHKHLCEKAILLSKFPNNPCTRGSFFKLNKKYAKLRKRKKREFKQDILNKLGQLL
jgi:hypothetical protein